MKHTGDYVLDEINMLEQECADLEEENKKLKEERDFFYKSAKQFREENEKLKEELKKYKKLHKYSNGELLTYSGD